MQHIACSIVCGESAIHYELIRLKRKSLEIAVYPNLQVVVRAPERFSLDVVEAHVRKRAGWIKKQINYFSQYTHAPPKQFVDGERHLYLGKQYRLSIKEAPHDRVVLRRRISSYSVWRYRPGVDSNFVE